MLNQKQHSLYTRTYLQLSLIPFWSVQLPVHIEQVIVIPSHHWSTEWAQWCTPTLSARVTACCNTARANRRSRGSNTHVLRAGCQGLHPSHAVRMSVVGRERVGGHSNPL